MLGLSIPMLYYKKKTSLLIYVASHIQKLYSSKLYNFNNFTSKLKLNRYQQQIININNPMLLTFINTKIPTLEINERLFEHFIKKY